MQISPEEQIQFLQKLIQGKLPISQESQELTKNILFVEELPGGWKFYGKTGAGDSSNKNKQIGWFVGWIEKDQRVIIFANYVEDEKKLDYSAGKQAKEEVRKKLLALIE